MRRRNLPPQQSAPPRRRTRRGLPWGKLFLLGLITLLALAWFAPTLIIKSSYRDRLLNSALKDFPGKVTLGSASAGWLSPVEITKASATDAQGEEVVSVAKVKTEKNLFSLLLDRQQIGKIRIEQPHFKLKLRPDGSNLEDLVKPFTESKGSSDPLGYAIEIVDGTVEATYAGSEAKWLLDKLNANIAIPRDKAAPFTAGIKSNVTAIGATPGTVSADVQWQPGSKAGTAGDAPAPGHGTVTLQSSGLPLELVTLALRHAGSDVQLSGSLSANASLAVTDKTQTVKIDQFAAQNLFVASPTLLGRDQIQLATVSGKGEIARGTGDWQFRNVSLQSDVGQLTAAGAGPRDGADSIGAELMRAFRAGTWEVRGNLDVAKLAAMLPTTLRLREGTHVSSGQLAIGLTSQSKPDGNLWNAQLEAQQLAAIHAGTAIEWKKPVLVKATVRESTAGIIVDQLTCDSSFLQLTGAGTLQKGQLVVNGDLNQFVNEVGRFMDLGAVRASGKFRGQVDWRNTGGEVLALTGNASATAFELTYVPERPWQEQQLDIQFESTGKIAGGRVIQIDRGNLNVTAAGDKLEAELVEQVTDISAETVWPCHLRVRGDLGRWLARGQMFVNLQGWQIDGDDIDLEGDLRASKQRFEFVTNRQLAGNGSNAPAGVGSRTTPANDNFATVKNFVFNGSGLSIQEQLLQIETAAAYDVVRSEFTSPATTIASSTVALRAEKTRLSFGDGKVAVDGDVKYRTNLERLSSWFQDARTPATYKLVGDATGSMQLAYTNGATRADMTASIDNFAYATPAKRAAGVSVTPLNQAATWQDLWKEPRLELAVLGSLDASGQQATIEKLEIAGDSLSIGATGLIRQPFTRCDLDMSGQYAYDLERLSQRLRGMLGPQVQMSGSGQRPFLFRGPLLAANPSQPSIRPASSGTGEPRTFSSLQEILAEASVAWQTLVIQGFDIGAGEVATKLDNGLLTISPIDVAASEGKIAIAPSVDLTKTPYMATLQPGTIVDRVRISPEMCHSWLKYLAPLAADATQAEGHFSVAIDQARFPVTDPTGGNIQGKLIVHSAQIGPGPLSQELLGVVQLVRSIIDKNPLPLGQQSSVGQWFEMPEQQLALQLADHKVYHKDMTFSVNDVVIKTSGWVGLDQQIALVAFVPVQDAWVAKNNSLASLRGQTIQLPINGTLTRPQLDRKALTQFTRQTVIGAGTNALENVLQKEVGRGLDRLFQPKGAPAPVPQQPPR